MEKWKPERTCCGCRKTFDKDRLCRIVRCPDGKVMLDKSGKAEGRGAYVCRNAACIAKALKSKAIDRTLKAGLPAEEAEELKKEAVPSDGR